ncbi:Solute carrier family 13 member 5 [Hypsibius exemplaris]|uniref:Solute carrier family 13 member 5 n=1 Tax=Hypsibius exemplaris TaxID=2072580 RepID=A0A1W0WVE6_HYPEX|nr:Solute carrier family 13 member 5 [Hypsibius exemplaris]
MGALKAVVKVYWKPVLALLLPIVLLPLNFVFEPPNVNAGRCGYVLLIMMHYWILDLIAIPITCLLPAILFPLLGIQKADIICLSYFQDSVMLMIGGLLVALAVEESHLHKRIALKVLLFVGSKPHWILGGFMGITGCLSMFINNTASTMMMLPIVMAVISELYQGRPDVEQHAPTTVIELKSISESINEIGNLSETDKSEKGEFSGSLPNAVPESKSSTGMNVMANKDGINFKSLSERQQDFSKALVLSVAYASNIGGFATLTGTLTNAIFLGLFNGRYKDARDVLSYASFSFFGLPSSILCLIFAWLSLTTQFIIYPYLRTRISESSPDTEQRMKTMFRTKYAELGPMSFAEGSVMAIFLTLVGLWFFRAPGFIAGWSSGFQLGFISDATPAVFMAVVLFLWPRRLPTYQRPQDGKPLPHPRKYEAILSWKVVAQKFPWDIVLFLGGALALAEGVKISGLTEVIKDQLEGVGSLAPLAVIVIVSLIVTFCTEVASNTAMASIFLPVVAGLAEVAEIHPLYYMLPVTVCCSFAFMFPVATAPNAIVFSSGFLKVTDMAKAGLPLNFGCLALMLGSLHTFGNWAFDLDNYPAWAPLQRNITATYPSLI